MADAFPEGSYFNIILSKFPDMVVIINASKISVFNGDQMGFYPPVTHMGSLPISNELNIIAESIKDLM